MGKAKLVMPNFTSSNAIEDKVILGVRPEHLLVNEDGDASWEGEVFVIEKLGSGTFLYIEKDNEPLVVATEGDSSIKVGDTIKVGFVANRCHVFEKNILSLKR